MKVVAIAVSSLDGKITRGMGRDTQAWASREDQEMFFREIKRAKLIVMGSTTYTYARAGIIFRPGQKRIILTRYPKKYSKENRPEALEFRSVSAKKLVKESRALGYPQMLVVGGSEIYQQFFKANLVDELWLTVEPLLFGRGLPLVADGLLANRFRLQSAKKLNRRGTLLLRYVRI